MEQDSFNIRVPYHTIESISKILFYQNEQLLHEIVKFKGWNREDIIKKYLIDTQKKIEVVNEKIISNDIENEEIKKKKEYEGKNLDFEEKQIPKENDKNEKCCARTGKGINSRCSIKKKKVLIYAIIIKKN